MPRTKRNGSSNSKNPPDFKRLKAKVGKKAPQAANLTDTSFRAASLHLTGQAVDKSQSSRQDVVISDRGRTLYELAQPLGHPASAVRLSAMKGIRNIVEQTPHEMLRPHWSILIPLVGKSMVDDDLDVRQVGRSVVHELLKNTDDESVWKPFVSLLVAYASSGLHSLDAPMRLDGARCTLILSQGIPKLICPHQLKLLPPYIGLLADRTMVRNTEEILQSLVSLLKTNNEKERITLSNDSDHVMLNGSTSRLSYIPEGRYARHVLKAIKGIKYLSNLDDLSGWQQSLDRFDQKNTSTAIDLYMKLRDLLIEVTGQGDTEEVANTTKGPMSLSKVGLTLQAIRWLWNMHMNPKDDRSSKMGHSILSMLLEIFPVSPDEARSNDPIQLEDLNLGIVYTIMNHAVCVESSMEWMKPLCKYLLPRVERSALQNSPSSINAFGELLLLFQDETQAKTRFEMIQMIYSQFFAKEDIELARSLSGRKAVYIIQKLSEKYNFLSDDDIDDELKEILTLSLLSLPFFLTAWEGDFAHESLILIKYFHDVVRRISLPGDPILVSLRASLAAIVVLPKGKTKKKHSIFETYASPLQRLFIGLVAMLESPSQDMIVGLGSICARSCRSSTSFTVSQPMADSIVECFHSIRKSMSMVSYLKFLVASTAVSKPLQKRPDETRRDLIPQNLTLIESLDSGIRRACRALIQCGSAKVLPMLTPILSGWLDYDVNQSEFENILRCRASISFLAMISFDIRGNTLETGVYNVCPNLFEPSIQGIFNVFFTHDYINDDSDNMRSHMSRIFSPVFALIRTESSLLTPVVSKISQSISERNRQRLSFTMQLLLHLVQDRRLHTAVKDPDVARAVRSILSSNLVEGSTLEFAKRLLAIVEVKGKKSETQERLNDKFMIGI